MVGGSGLGTRVGADAGQELAGRPGRRTGNGRQVGPSLGLGKVRGGGEGPGQVRTGGPRESLWKCLLGSWEKLCPGDEVPCFCPGQ